MSTPPREDASSRVLRDTPARAARRLLFETAPEDILQNLFLDQDRIQTLPPTSPPGVMADVEDDIGEAPPPPPPAAKDPLDFNTLTVTSHLVAWANDPKNSKSVKTRDREEIIFLQSMQKYETHFSEEDRRSYRRRLHLYFIVSDLNWNAALNDQKELL